MSALKWIIAEAKKIKKQYPKRFKTWTEYVKQASAIYATKHKSKSPVGKKHKVGAVKKTATKKPKVKTVETRHKDTKSHNVNIRVVSGLEKHSNKIIDELNYINNRIQAFEINRDRIKFNIKYKKYNKEDLPKARKMLKNINDYIKHLKATLRATKKHVK